MLAAQGKSAETLGYLKLSLTTAFKLGDREGIEKARHNISVFRAQLGGDHEELRLRAEAESVLSGDPPQELLKTGDRYM